MLFLRIAFLLGATLLQGISGLSYQLSAGANFFLAATADCQSQGLFLATAETASLQAEVAAAASGTAIWLGLQRDTGNPSQFLWDTTGSPVSYNNWLSGQPDNNGGSEDCVRMNADGTWSDTDCFNFLYYLCASDPAEFLGCYPHLPFMDLEPLLGAVTSVIECEALALALDPLPCFWFTHKDENSSITSCYATNSYDYGALLGSTRCIGSGTDSLGGESAVAVFRSKDNPGECDAEAHGCLICDDLIWDTIPECYVQVGSIKYQRKRAIYRGYSSTGKSHAFQARTSDCATCLSRPEWYPGTFVDMRVAFCGCPCCCSACSVTCNDGIMNGPEYGLDCLAAPGFLTMTTPWLGSVHSSGYGVCPYCPEFFSPGGRLLSAPVIDVSLHSMFPTPGAQVSPDLTFIRFIINGTAFFGRGAFRLMRFQQGSPSGAPQIHLLLNGNQSFYDTFANNINETYSKNPHDRIPYIDMAPFYRDGKNYTAIRISVPFEHPATLTNTSTAFGPILGFDPSYPPTTDDIFAIEADPYFLVTRSGVPIPIFDKPDSLTAATANQALWYFTPTMAACVPNCVDLWNFELQCGGDGCGGLCPEPHFRNYLYWEERNQGCGPSQRCPATQDCGFTPRTRVDPFRKFLLGLERDNLLLKAQLRALQAQYQILISQIIVCDPLGPQSLPLLEGTIKAPYGVALPPGPAECTWIFYPPNSIFNIQLNVTLHLQDGITLRDYRKDRPPSYITSNGTRISTASTGYVGLTLEIPSNVTTTASFIEVDYAWYDPMYSKPKCDDP